MPTRIVIARDYRDGQQFINAQKDIAARLNLPVPAFDVISTPEQARGRQLHLDDVIFTPRFAVDHASAQRLIGLTPAFMAGHAKRSKDA